MIAKRATTARSRDESLLPEGHRTRQPDSDATLHCGWGRLIFGSTFSSAEDIARELCREGKGERDIAVYVTDPHVALSVAPQELFLDPSHMLRLWLPHYRHRRERAPGFIVRRLKDARDADEVNRLFAMHRMAPADAGKLVTSRNSRTFTQLVAEHGATGEIVGTVTGIDHKYAFSDPELGASLWCLAVDPQCSVPKIGEMLVRGLAEHYKARGRSFLDLSVMHDNAPAIALYEALGFVRLPVFAIKRKNPINEDLFIAPQPEDSMNPYAGIIVREARRRGIGIEVEDAEAGIFRLSFGGRTISCRESLSDLTSSVALARCDDKALTRRLLAADGLQVPDQAEAGSAADNRRFLEHHGRIVVKPARGEQGAGISVDIRAEEEMAGAIEKAGEVCEKVLLEQFCDGEDLRIVVIGNEAVAAAVRRPAAVTGNGRDDISELIRVQSRRRAAATGGESRIPLDAETERCVGAAGYRMTDILPEGKTITVRRTANLHTGGTIHDVTSALHEDLRKAACRAARVLDIPVVGFDFLTPDVTGPDYVIIEANERPGLANHEPQPTAERFVDLLFPHTRRREE
ncbi:MAG: N-acetylglutaminylglutamine synthetase [Rhodospirillales bacterium]